MSDWTNLDVTPVGGAPGSRADAPRPTSLSSGEDPFGSRPTRRRRGWIRVVLGTLLMLGGVVASIAGIVAAIDARVQIDERAVARGVVRDGIVGRPQTFAVAPGERRRYSVYLLSGGLGLSEEVEEVTVRDTGCVATMPDGVQTSFRGARQGNALTLGDASSVGIFSSLPGEVKVLCGYVSGNRRSRINRPDTIPYVVTEGVPAGLYGGIGLIVGGVFGAIAGGFLFAWGWRRRRAV